MRDTFAIVFVSVRLLFERKFWWEFLEIALCSQDRVQAAHQADQDSTYEHEDGMTGSDMQGREGRPHREMYQVPRQMAFSPKGQASTKVVCRHAGRKEAKWIGFGLAIVQRIARLLGGTAEVVIEVGRGTTITLTFAARSARG